MWDYIAPVTAIALAVMGIIPALSAFRRRIQVLWIAGIVSIVIVSVVASVFSIRSMHADQDQLLGSDNFLTVIAVLPVISDIKGPFPLLIINDQPLPAYDVSVQIINMERVNSIIEMLKAGRGSQASRAELFDLMMPKPLIVGTILAHTAFNKLDDISVTFGKYQIRIQTTRALFIESLDLYMENGEIKQCVDVMRAGSSEKLRSGC
jgi:hypothetical protein